MTDDNDLMLWALGHGWTLFMHPTGWKWYAPMITGAGYYVETGCIGDRTNDLPRLNDTVREAMLEAWEYQQRKV